MVVQNALENTVRHLKSAFLALLQPDLNVICNEFSFLWKLSV